MDIRVVTLLAISTLFILHFTPSFADLPIVEWDFTGGYSIDDGAATGTH